MVRLVEPAALEVVTEAPDHGDAEIDLRGLREGALEAAVVGGLLPGDGAHDRHERRAQLLEERRHGGHRHAFVGAIDQRVGNVGVRPEEAGVLPAEVECLLQQRPHGGEIIGWPRARPGIVGRRAESAPAGNEIAGHPGCLVEVAAHDADEAGIIGVVGQALGKGEEVIEQPAERRVDELLVREPAQSRALSGPRLCAAAGACRWPGPSSARRRRRTGPRSRAAAA